MPNPKKAPAATSTSIGNTASTLTTGATVTLPPSYLGGLTRTASALATKDGCAIAVWELRVPVPSDELKSWASRFRQHYCPDAEIDELRKGTGLSRADYLTRLVFPDKHNPPGPGIRAGDFAELLVTDYVEFVLGYWVPRGKYADKASRNESVKGVDIVGFRQSAPPASTPTDVLLTFEVKAQLTGTSYNGRLQSAIDDSSKDYLRLGMTLNAAKRRLLQREEREQALVVERFQSLADRPYLIRCGAAAVLTDSAFDEQLLQEGTEIAGHQSAGALELIVVRGKDLMLLAHALYEQAANEA